MIGRKSGNSALIAPFAFPVLTNRLLPVFCCLVSLLPACTLSNTMESVKIDNTLTTSAVENKITDKIEPSDLNVIREMVASPYNFNSDIIAWHNAQTGNHGSITSLNEVSGANGRLCRNFETSLDSYAGISSYSGVICKIGNGNWILSEMRQAEDVIQ